MWQAHVEGSILKTDPGPDQVPVQSKVGSFSGSPAGSPSDPGPWGPGGDVVQELKDVIWKVGERRRQIADAHVQAEQLVPVSQSVEISSPLIHAVEDGPSSMTAF
jgi:hypothetical protein